MATKKSPIAKLADRSMEERTIPENKAPPSQKASPPSVPHRKERFKPTPKETVLIRLDEGDYGRLQNIAEQKGTKASALIRQAVKEIIKTETGAIG